MRPFGGLHRTTVVLWVVAAAVLGGAAGAWGAAPPITEFPVPTASSFPTGITAGPDGNLWFTEANGNKIGRITPAGGITEFLIPTASSGPLGITAGLDGNLWFTEFTGNKIGRIAPAVFAEIAVYRTPTGQWFIRRVTDAGLRLVAWGAPGLGDVPVPARY